MIQNQPGILSETSSERKYLITQLWESLSRDIIYAAILHRFKKDSGRLQRKKVHQGQLFAGVSPGRIV